MTLESVIAKLMWILGNAKDDGRTIDQMFYQKINYDIIFNETRAGR